MHDFAGNVHYPQISKLLFLHSLHRKNTLQSGCQENVLSAIVVQILVLKVFLNIRCGIDFQKHYSVEMWFSRLTYISCVLIYQLFIVCHLLGSQKMTRIVLIDETFIFHNLLFCVSNQTLGWLGLRKC